MPVYYIQREGTQNVFDAHTVNSSNPLRPTQRSIRGFPKESAQVCAPQTSLPPRDLPLIIPKSLALEYMDPENIEQDNGNTIILSCEESKP